MTTSKKRSFACCLFITPALDDYRQLAFYVNELTHCFSLFFSSSVLRKRLNNYVQQLRFFVCQLDIIKFYDKFFSECIFFSPVTNMEYIKWGLFGWIFFSLALNRMPIHVVVYHQFKAILVEIDKEKCKSCEN